MAGKVSRLVGVALTALMVSTTGALSQTNAARDAFIRGIWSDASARGVSRATFDQAFRGYKPIKEVERQTQSQPELQQGVGDYVEKRVNPRVAPGRAKSAELAGTLARIERQYGVQAEVLLSVWGVETNFGSFLGGKNVIHALATLTERGYRANYFRGELLTALDILQQGHIRADSMVGSWAGAMGHTQFMPSSYVNFAQDFDGDGRKDIWTSKADALASTANYLRKNGWRPGETWGYEVRLPARFDYRHAWADEDRPIAQWQKLGVQRIGDRAFPRAGDRATLYLPAGRNGPAFLLLPNFEVIKRYNNSNSYALAVGHLADRIAGGSPFMTAWPQEKFLTRAQRIDLQTRLSELSYEIGEIDGVLGRRTREAVAAFQIHLGMPADGFPDRQLMSVLGIES